MAIVVRTWNLFHGRTLPETRGGQVERMVRLVTAGEPDLVALQELPVWSLPRLEDWSGMHAVITVTRHAWLGRLGRAVAARWPARVRSGLTGQANATLVRADHELRWPVATLRLARRREPRLAHAVVVRVAGRDLLVSSTHLTNEARVAERELEQLTGWLLGLAGTAPIVLAGDLNVSPVTTRAFVTLAASGWSAPAHGIDHVLGRGLHVLAGPVAWPDERRRLDAVLLSDHAPVEAEMMWP